MSDKSATFPEFSMSHVGLFVFDLDRMVDFYTSTFGLLLTDTSIVRGDKRIAFMSRDPREHHQIVLVEGRMAPLEAQLLNQISLRVGSLDDLREVDEIVSKSGATGVDRSNHGNAFSIYFRDPEGNRLEVFTDSPYYVEQAVQATLVLTCTDEEILKQTRDQHADHPSFSSADEWSARMQQRLDEAAQNKTREA